MKKIFIFLTIVTMASSVLISSCKKEDEVKFTEKDSVNVIKVLKRSKWDIHGKYNPVDGEQNVPVGVVMTIKPQFALNAPFDVDLAGTTCTYRYDHTSCAITDPSGNNFLTNYQYNENDTCIYITNKILNPDTQYSLTSTIVLSQLVDGNWQPVVYKGAPLEHTYSSVFQTGQLADTINPADILFSYPIDRQLNYMPKEYTKGYIMLSNTYREFFEGISSNDMKLVVRNISDENTSDQTTTYTVSESHEVEKQIASIDFSLNNINFQPNTIYTLMFYCGAKKIHQIYFRTSYHPDLKTRLDNNKSFFDGELRVVISDVGFFTLIKEGKLDENPDKFECQTLNGYSDKCSENMNTCLMPMELVLDNADWYLQTPYKNIYDNYPPAVDFYTYPYAFYHNPVKFPPVNALTLYPIEYNWEKGWDETVLIPCLSDENIKTKTIDATKQYIYLNDFYNFAETEYRAHGLDNYVVFYEGNYVYNISYRLPGKNIITSKHTHSLTKTKTEQPL